MASPLQLYVKHPQFFSRYSYLKGIQRDITDDQEVVLPVRRPKKLQQVRETKKSESDKHVSRVEWSWLFSNTAVYFQVVMRPEQTLEEGQKVNGPAGILLTVNQPQPVSCVDGVCPSPWMPFKNIWNCFCLCFSFFPRWPRIWWRSLACPRRVWWPERTWTCYWRDTRKHKTNAHLHLEDKNTVVDPSEHRGNTTNCRSPVDFRVLFIHFFLYLILV